MKLPMWLRRSVSVAFVVGFLALCVPQAAMATSTLPGSGRLFALSSGQNGTDTNAYAIVPGTSAATPVGAGFPANVWAIQAGAYDPTTKLAYVPFYNGELHLGSMPLEGPNAGELADIGRFRAVGNNPEQYPEVDALAIAPDGTAYAVSGPFGGTAALFTVDLSTAELTLVNTMGPPHNYIDSLAFNPVDGHLYLTDIGSLWRVSTADASLTYLGDLNAEPDANDVYGMQFDASGRAWMIMDNNTGPKLYTFTIATLGTLEPQVESTLSDAVARYFYSLILVPEWQSEPDTESLPDTGFSPTAALVTGGALLSLGFVSLSAVLAKRRRAND